MVLSEHKETAFVDIAGLETQMCVGNICAIPNGNILSPMASTVTEEISHYIISH